MMTEFDPHCRRCPRLAAFLDEGRARHPGYHCAPVAPFGDGQPRLLIVGLAPGFHGANATGRPFTGDYAGVLLYETLHAFGWASAPVSSSRDDGLVLTGARITNAVKCVPPGNKPTPAEIATCNDFLRAELAGLPAGHRRAGTRRHRARCGAARAGVRRRGIPLRATVPSTCCPSGRVPDRFLPLQPLQHQHAATDHGDVPAMVGRASALATEADSGEADSG